MTAQEALSRAEIDADAAAVPTPSGMPERASARPACSFDGCGKVTYVRGLCTTHYNRMHRAGRLDEFSSDDVKPCGTAAAYRRHVRAGEAPCGACLAAEAQARRERYAADRAKAVAASAPTVAFDGGAVTITASMDDARAIAAAALDRALSLEKVSGATGQAVEQRAKGAMLRAVHKAVVSHARAAA